MNLKTHLNLLLGVLIGIALCKTFKSCNDNYEPTIYYPAQTTAEAKKELQQKEQHFLAKEDSLKKQDAGLKKELAKAKHSLQQLKENNSFIKAQLLGLLDKKIQADSSLNYTDTLGSKLNEFIDNCNEKDSSYEAVTDNLEQQVNNKDSLISIQQEKYAELKAALLKSIDEKDLLAKDNNQLRKQFKKQKIKRRVVSALVLIAAGTAAGILLHH